MSRNTRNERTQPAQVHLQPSFARQVAPPHFNAGWYEHMISSWGKFIGFFGMIPCCFCCPNPFKVVDQGKVGLKCQFGKCFEVVDPGLHNVNPACQQLDVVDIRIQVTDIPRQNVFTRDNVTVNIDSVLYWHVTDPYAVVYLVQNINQTLIEKTQTVLREIIGQRTVQETLEHRDEVADQIEQLMAGPAMEYGVKIEAILIKDMQFSADLLESFSSAIKQKRVGEAKVIAAQAEVEAAKMMKEGLF
eukprot:NODE_692_length_4692_cov_0.413238.p2 type:complete len:246 gc:universal NODE_692_length_4692_cov_0.413238:3543-2806(-)